MKLHRLVLTNYRGIIHREIEFPDHGVVVVSGANEIGKSSMIEALDLLLEPWGRSALAVFVGDGHGVDIGGMGASSIAVDETHGNGAAAGSCRAPRSATMRSATSATRPGWD